jgi:hypothetical protein
MNANLAFWDHIDGKADWPLDEQGGHSLTELLRDFMVVDISKPPTEDSFFEIEQRMPKGAQPVRIAPRRWYGPPLRQAESSSPTDQVNLKEVERWLM